MANNMNNMMRQARKMQAQLEQIQNELGNIEVEASAGGGAVKVVATCDEQIKSIHINPAAIDPEDAELLEDAIVAAVNDAITKAKETASDRMSAVTGGLGLGGFGF